jgi:hypothetical protein
MEPRKPFLLRISPGLWKELEAWAQEDLRSVNGQMEFLLTQAVRRRKNIQGDETARSKKGKSPAHPD